jgi:hypothetical protein
MRGATSSDGAGDGDAEAAGLAVAVPEAAGLPPGVTVCGGGEAEPHAVATTATANSGRERRIVGIATRMYRGLARLPTTQSVKRSERRSAREYEIAPKTSRLHPLRPARHNAALSSGFIAEGGADEGFCRSSG